MQAGPELPLFDRTMLLLEDALQSINAKEIAEATELSEAWLSRFRNGKIPNPGVQLVQTLHDYLAGL